MTKDVHSGRKWLLPGAAYYVPNAVQASLADRSFDTLLEEVEWEQHRVRLFGKMVACPRLSAWYGDADARYSYSGVRLEPRPWLESLQVLKERVEASTGERFNSVLLNLYRTGADSMGWHADDEPELGEHPVVASISLGATRRFRLKPNKAPNGSAVQEDESIAVDLEHGSLLVMQGRCQQEYKHAVPKTRRAVGPRINLTFRLIQTS